MLRPVCRKTEIVCVLIVEDEPMLLTLMAEFLEDAGYDVMAAEHGLKAMTLIEQWPTKFTMLVTDYHMPHGITGGHLIEHMRQSYSSIPMLIATARADAVTAQFRERHRVEMLIKPYGMTNLVKVVRRLLGHADGLAVSSHLWLATL